MNLDIIYGNENPILGWYSESFYLKEKTNTIYLTALVYENMEFVSQIKIGAS
jgi:hypothetical protein